MQMVQGSEIWTSKTNQNDTKERAAAQPKSINNRKPKNKNIIIIKNPTPHAAHHPNPRNESSTVSLRGCKLVSGGTPGAGLDILGFKIQKMSMLRALRSSCFPTGGCWSARNDPHQEPGSLPNAARELSAPRPTASLTALFSYQSLERQNFTLLKVSQRWQEWEGKKTILTSHIQSIVTRKLCKRRHVSGIIRQLVSLLSDASRSLLYALIVGVLNERGKEVILTRKSTGSCFAGVCQHLHFQREHPWSFRFCKFGLELHSFTESRPVLPTSSNETGVWRTSRI